MNKGMRYVFLHAMVFVFLGTALASDNTMPSVVPLAGTHQSGQGNSFSAPYQWYKIPIKKGKTVTVKLVSVSPGDSVYLKLYPPETMDGRHQHVAEENTKIKTLTYSAPKSGAYLLRVFSFSTGPTSYTFTWSK